MPKYAKRTSVTIDKSRREVEAILVKYGAKEFAFFFATDLAAIQFRMKNLQIRFEMPLPKDSRDADQERRQRWRALALVIKAKLEAVECKVTTLEEEFLAHVVLPGGKTFGEIAIPQIEQARASGKLPQGLLEHSGTEGSDHGGLSNL